MPYLIGIDNTDNRMSRGTGFRSRQMASELELAGFGKVLGITRHQLFVSGEIPLTSQNSANTIQVDCCDCEGLKSFCRNFLKREALAGCNSGLCILDESEVVPEIEEWGRRAKREVLSLAEAFEIASRNNIILDGIVGDHNGAIGALAAVGLRKTGNDGRFIWQPGRQLKDLRGPLTVEEFKKGTQVDDIITMEGLILGPKVSIDLTDWVRAVLVNNKTYVIVERNLKRSGSDWKVADKEYIRKIGS